jgi:hypothetical protein
MDKRTGDDIIEKEKGKKETIIFAQRISNG